MTFPTHALHIEGLRKRYENHIAVGGLDLKVPAGCIYGILGPNGAGKSTTIRCALNIVSRDAGSVSIFGVDPRADRTILRRIGYLPEERGLYKSMSVMDVIIFFARLKGVATGNARAKAEQWLDRMGLGDWRRAKVEALSKGMQQKVQFIATVVHEPDLLILDEPAAGLDPVNQEVMRETILTARKEGRTVVFSTHNMEQAESLCESVCIIAQGEKVLDGALHDIRRSFRSNRYRVSFDGATAPPPADAAQQAVLRDVQPFAQAWEFSLAPGADAGSAFAVLHALRLPIAKFERIEPSLHQIFIDRVRVLAQPVRREIANV
jgi:ABC-2 type transport system ATP-binding protein